MCSPANCTVGFRHRIVLLIAGLNQKYMFLWLSALSTSPRSGGQLLFIKKMLQCIVSAFTMEPFSTRGTVYCNVTETVKLICYTLQRKDRKY